MSVLIELMYRYLVYYSAQFVYWNDKGTRRKGEIYISFIRYPHDLRIERISRDYTLCQIEDFGTSYRDTCRDLKIVVVTADTPGKDVIWSITIITTTLSCQMTTIRLGTRHRAKNTLSITMAHSDTGEGYYLKLTSWWSTRSFSSLYVHLTNVANDRSRTIVETDWSTFIILIMSSLSTLWFYDTYRDRWSTLSIKSSTELSNLIHYFRDEYDIESCAHTSCSDSSDSVEHWDTSTSISRWYAHVLFPPFSWFQRFLRSSIIRDYDATEWICQLRSRDDNVARPSSAISLGRTENTLFDITCHASECLLLQTKKSQDNTHSIVRHCPWTGSHPLYYCLRSTLQSSSDNMTKILDKRLTWTLCQREKKTTSSHSDQCHRARPGDDHLQEGLRSCVFSWYGSLESGLVKCFWVTSHIKLQIWKRQFKRSEVRDVVFENQTLDFTVVETMITSTRYTAAQTTRK